MPIEEERRADCKYYQKTVDDLKYTVYGNGQPGLKMEISNIKTKVNIFISLQIMTLTAIASMSIKIIFFGIN